MCVCGGGGQNISLPWLKSQSLKISNYNTLHVFVEKGVNCDVTISKIFHYILNVHESHVRWDICKGLTSGQQRQNMRLNCCADLFARATERTERRIPDFIYE